MAKIDKPATTKIAPPPAKKIALAPMATSKPAPSQTKPLQFQLAAKEHQEFKLYATEQGMSMTELFMAMYKEYRAKHG